MNVVMAGVLQNLMAGTLQRLLQLLRHLNELYVTMVTRGCDEAVRLEACPQDHHFQSR